MKAILRVAAILSLIEPWVQGDPCVGDGVVITEPGVSHTSPGYQEDGSGAYTNDLTCKWNITAPEGKKIVITFTDMFIEDSDLISLWDVGVDDVVAESEDSTDLRLAHSTGNSVSLIFTSDVDIVENGFKFHFDFIEPGSACGEGHTVVTGGDSGHVSSDGYQEDGEGMYAANSNCAWTFKVEPGYKLDLHFSNMSLEGGCDYVTVYNDDTEEEIGDYDGEAIEAFSLGPFSHSVRVVFTSDASYQYNGFSLSYNYTVPSAPVPENQCVDNPAPSDGFIVSCDCRMRYLKHTAVIAPSATPCLSPPGLLGRSWDSIEEGELTCSQTALPPMVRARYLTPHGLGGFCAWPPVSALHPVTSLLQCATLCMDAPDCLYVNVKEVSDDGGELLCGVTSFSLPMVEEPIADTHLWRSYLVAQ